MTSFLGVGWGFPVTVTPGGDNEGEKLRFQLAEYEESIRQSIRIILFTAKGERVMRPDFGCGIFELVFSPNTTATRGLAEHHVSEALSLWEPRIELLGVKVAASGSRDEIMLINIEYRVCATDNRFNMVYPFYLDRGVQP